MTHIWDYTNRHQLAQKNLRTCTWHLWLDIGIGQCKSSRLPFCVFYICIFTQINVQMYNSWVWRSTSARDDVQHRSVLIWKRESYYWSVQIWSRLHGICNLAFLHQFILWSFPGRFTGHRIVLALVLTCKTAKGRSRTNVPNAENHLDAPLTWCSTWESTAKKSFSSADSATSLSTNFQISRYIN